MVNIIRLVIPLMWLRGKRGRLKQHGSNISRETPDLFSPHSSCFSRALGATSAEGDRAALSTLTGCTLAHRVLGPANFTFNSYTRSTAFCFFLGGVGGASVVPERRVGGLVQGFVSEQGGAGRSHVVVQEGGNVFGGGAAEELQPLLKDLLPALQRFQHGVTQGRAHGQICGGGRGWGRENTREQTKTQLD